VPRVLLLVGVQLEKKVVNEFEIKEYVREELGTLPPNRWHPYSQFDGTGDPRLHLQQFQSISQLNKLSAKEMLNMFPTALATKFHSWYYGLEDYKKASWMELSQAFLKHFSFNTRMNIRLRELETMTQNKDETFAAYLRRWRDMLMMVKTMPEEDEQIKIYF